MGAFLSSFLCRALGVIDMDLKKVGRSKAKGQLRRIAHNGKTEEDREIDGTMHSDLDAGAHA